MQQYFLNEDQRSLIEMIRDFGEKEVRPYQSEWDDKGIFPRETVEKAFELGCDRVVLLLTKPKDVPRRGGSDRRVAAVIRRKYPASAVRLLEQADAINGKVELALRYEREGRLLIVAPDDIMGLETLTRDRRALRRLYDKGYADAAAIPGFLSRE